jgi:hypothetical protein
MSEDEVTDYAGAFSQTRSYIARYDRIFAPVREGYSGKPQEEVYAVLVQAFQSEGIVVWDEVIRDAARLISQARPSDRKR